MVIEMISNQVPKLIGDQFDRPSNVHGKMGPKSGPSRFKEACACGCQKSRTPLKCGFFIRCCLV